MSNTKPNALIYGARCDRMMEACGGKGFFVEEDPKDLECARGGDELPRPRPRQVVVSQGAAVKPQQFRWHS